MASIGDLVKGFQGGYEFSSGVRRDRQIEKALDYELAGQSAKRKADLAGYEKYGQDYGGGFEGLPQTYGEKLMGSFKGWAGNLFNRDQQAIDPAAPAAPAAPQQQPNPFIPRADGGAVRHMRKKYANGGRSLVSNQSQQGRTTGVTRSGGSEYADGGPKVPQALNTGGPVSPVALADGGAYSSGLHRVPMPMAEGGMPPRIEQLSREQARIERARLAAEKAAGRGRLSRAGRAVGRAVAPIALGATAAETASTPTEDYRERFALPRETGGDLDEAAAAYEEPSLMGAATDPEFWGDVGVRALGAASDLGSAMTFGGADRFYRDEQTEAVRALPQDAPSEQVASNVAAQPAAPTAETAPTTPQGPTAPAASSNVQGADEGYDWTQVDVMPEDIPSHSVKDWEEERKFYAAQAIANGRDPLDAMKEVDASQMRGFNQHGQQAFQLLRQGNAPAAARALKAAYQYFPNGVDVKFGISKGTDGQPVLIGMGVDEESGEPIQEGKPMVITAESLATQLENMSNPAAFRTWTKDWRDAEQEIREYEEVTKPEAQSQADLRAAQGQYYSDRGVAAILDAEATAAGGGMKRTDRDRVFDRFMSSQELAQLDDPAKAEDLADIMSRVFLQYPDEPYPSIIKYVMAAERAGTLDEELGKLGIK